MISRAFFSAGPLQLGTDQGRAPDAEGRAIAVNSSISGLAGSGRPGYMFLMDARGVVLDITSRVKT